MRAMRTYQGKHSSTKTHWGSEIGNEGGQTCMEVALACQRPEEKDDPPWKPGPPAKRAGFQGGGKRCLRILADSTLAISKKAKT